MATKKLLIFFYGAGIVTLLEPLETLKRLQIFDRHLHSFVTDFKVLEERLVVSRYTISVENLVL